MASESSESQSPSPSPSESTPAATSASNDSPTERSDSNPSAPTPTARRLISARLDMIRTPDGENHRFELDPTALGELAKSMKADGLINPVRLRSTDDGWLLVAGCRRVAAARSLDWQFIDATIANADHGDDESQRLAENLFRADLSPVEEAHAIQRLYDPLNFGIDACAARLNRSPFWIESRLAIAQYPEPLLKALHQAHISIGVADELSHINSPTQMVALLDTAIASGCTRRQAQLWRMSANAQLGDPTGNHGDANIIPVAGPPPTVVRQCFSCETEHDVTGMSYVTICGECMARIRDVSAQQHRLELDNPPPRTTRDPQ